MFLLNGRRQQNLAVEMIVFTIQNVSIKFNIFLFSSFTKSLFTIQNVSIKYRMFIKMY